ncbi:hypothetical protein PBRA_006826, partial [Plasmodiophora brassicae]
KDDARLAYWHGKLRTHASEAFDQAAVEYLQNAVRQDPALYDAWNCLGECYWKKRDMPSARSCFESAIAHNPNPRSYQNLSIVIRSSASKLSPGPEVLESVEASRMALKLDVRDGHSWYLFGNAMLSKFFLASHDPADLSSAFKAYQKAEAALVHSSSNNPDMYFNRATARWYMEDYSLAIQDFSKAASLDPSLTIAADHIAEIESFVSRLVRQIASRRGTAKPKSPTDPETTYTMIRAQYPNRLPAFPGPGSTSDAVQKWSQAVQAGCEGLPKDRRAQLLHATSHLVAKQLSAGRPMLQLASLPTNGQPTRGLLCLEMSVSVFRKRGIPCTMVCVSGQEAVAVSVYHTTSDALGTIRPGDPVFIVDPIARTVEVVIQDRPVSYPCIQVKDPRTLIAGPAPFAPVHPQLRFDNQP